MEICAPREHNYTMPIQEVVFLCAPREHNYTMPIQEVVFQGKAIINVAYVCTKCGDITPKKEKI